MKNTIRKITALALAVMTLCGGVSCGKNKPEGKQRVKVAVSYKSPMLCSAVERYNSTHENSVIELVEYADSEDTEAENTADDLCLEISAGDYPDIIDLSIIDNTELDSMGMCTDLYPFLDSDDELSRESFFPGVFTACEKEGKLISLPVAYKTISVSAGKSKFFEDFTELDNAYIMELAEKYPDKLLSPFHTNSSVFIFGLFDLNQFIDYENYTCNFNSEEFIDILEFCSQYPAEVEFLTTPDENILTDKALIHSFQVNIFTNPDFKKTFGDEEYTVLETNFHYGIRLAITESCPDKNIAWDFISEVYNVESGDDFPVTVKQFEAMRDSFVTQQQYDFAYDILSRTDGFTEAVSDDIAIIISEETDECFNGGTSPQECAEIIQNRISIYLSEKS
ncbi:MAG: hypothetical protein E7500_01635 [Ruminococcus sp.]|nr:hypothetical protein [Ruminococcus sp.]